MSYLAYRTCLHTLYLGCQVVVLVLCLLLQSIIIKSKSHKPFRLVVILQALMNRNLNDFHSNT